MDRKEMDKLLMADNIFSEDFEISGIFRHDANEILTTDLLEQSTESETVSVNRPDEDKVNVNDIEEMLMGIIDQVASADNYKENEHAVEQNNSLCIFEECSQLLKEMVQLVSENNLQQQDNLLKHHTVREFDNFLPEENYSKSIENLNENVAKLDFTDKTNFGQKTAESGLTSITHNINDDQLLKAEQPQIVSVQDLEINGCISNQFPFIHLKDEEILSNTTTSDRFEFELDDIDVLESCDLVKSDIVNHVDIQSLPSDDIESVWEFYDSESITESDFEDMLTTDFCKIVSTDVAMTYANQNGNSKANIEPTTMSIKTGHVDEIASDANKLTAPNVNCSLPEPKETTPTVIESSTLTLPKKENPTSKVNDILQNQTIQTKIKLNYADLNIKDESSKNESHRNKSKAVQPTYSKQISVDSASSENSFSSSVESDTSSGKRKHDFPISITHLTKYFSKGKRAIFSNKKKKKGVKQPEKYDSDEYSASSSDLSDEDDLKDPADTGFESDSSTDLEKQTKGRSQITQIKKSVAFEPPDDHHIYQKQVIEEKYKSLKAQLPNKARVTNSEVRPIQQNVGPQLSNPRFSGAPIQNLQEINHRLPGSIIPPPGIQPIRQEGPYGPGLFLPGYQRPMVQQPRCYYDARQGYPSGPMAHNPMPFQVANHENMSYGPNHPPMFSPVNRYQSNIPNYNQRLPFNIPTQLNPWMHQQSPILDRRQPNSPILARRSMEHSLDFHHFNHNVRPPVHRPVRPQFSGPPSIHQEDRRLSDTRSVKNPQAMRKWVDDLDRRSNQLGRSDPRNGAGSRDYNYRQSKFDDQEEVIRRRSVFANSDSEEDELYSFRNSRRTRSQSANNVRFTDKQENDSWSEYNTRPNRSRRTQRGDRYSPVQHNKTKIDSDSYDDFMIEFARDLTNPNVSKRERRFRCDVLDEIHKLMPAFPWNEMLNFYDYAVQRFQRIFHSEWDIPRKEAAVKTILVEMVEDLLPNEQNDMEDRHISTQRRTSSRRKPTSSCDENVARSLYKNGSRQCEYVTTTTMLCKTWNRSGYCRQGADCPYKHCCVRCATEDERTAHHPALECPYFDG